MRILQLFGLGDTSTLLTVGLRHSGMDCDLLLSNRAFVTQYHAWTRNYPELATGCYQWNKANTLDPRTIADLYRFVRKYDLVFAHPPAGADAWNFDVPYVLWDGGSGNFFMNAKHEGRRTSDQIKHETVRRSYKKARWIFFNDINVIHTAWEHMPWKHDRYCYMPLPVDTSVFHPMNTEKFDTFVVYLPTRQEENIKGIGDILQGFALFTTHAPEAQLWITQYGSDVPVTRYLTEELHIQDKVRFVPLIPKTQFAELINRVDVVIDQLRLNALGGVTVQSMACEQRVIVAANEQWYKDALGEAPPILNAHSAQDVYLRLLECYTKKHQNLKKKARKYILKHFEYNTVANKVKERLQTEIQS